MDDLFRGKSSQGLMTMTVVTKHWKRTLTMQWWSKGKDRSLVRILAPKKEAGTATLRVGNDVWNYLPKVKRVIKLPSSMMSGSWMGSHFTNDDLVKESRMADDYTFKITFQGCATAGRSSRSPAGPSPTRRWSGARCWWWCKPGTTCRFSCATLTKTCTRPAPCTSPT